MHASPFCESVVPIVPVCEQGHSRQEVQQEADLMVDGSEHPLAPPGHDGSTHRTFGQDERHGFESPVGGKENQEGRHQQIHEVAEVQEEVLPLPLEIVQRSKRQSCGNKGQEEVLHCPRCGTDDEHPEGEDHGSQEVKHPVFSLGLLALHFIPQVLQLSTHVRQSRGCMRTSHGQALRHHRLVRVEARTARRSGPSSRLVRRFRPLVVSWYPSDPFSSRSKQKGSAGVVESVAKCAKWRDGRGCASTHVSGFLCRLTYGTFDRPNPPNGIPRSASRFCGKDIEIFGRRYRCGDALRGPGSDLGNHEEEPIRYGGVFSHAGGHVHACQGPP
eukprot:scaffold1401_cov330-Pavlova_lutheri.AAC.6